MKRERPRKLNKKDIPVNIFKGEELIAECHTIQEAAKFLKKEIGSKRFRWAPINKGIWFNEPYSINGATYFFVTDEESVRNKLDN